VQFEYEHSASTDLLTFYSESENRKLKPSKYLLMLSSKLK